MSNFVIELPEDMKTFVNRKVTQGAYSNPSELIQQLLAKEMASEGQEELEQKLLAAVEQDRKGLSIEWTKKEFDLLLKEHRERFAAQE